MTSAVTTTGEARSGAAPATKRRRPIRRGPTAKKEQRSAVRRGPAPWLMIAPAVVGIMVFQYYPVLVAVVHSMQRFDPFTHAPIEFAGLDNYIRMFTGADFQTSLWNTLLYVVISLLIEIPLSLGLAVLIDRKLPGTRFVRIAVIATLAASETVAAIVWAQMYSPDQGLLNGILGVFGLPPQSFLSSSGQSLISVVVMSSWKNIGIPTLIFLTGLQAIPRDYYEAAAIDGAGNFRQFTKITVPLLRGSSVVVLFMSTLAATRIFVPIVLMTQGGPNGATSNLVYYSYEQAFQYNSAGTASAAAIFMLAFLGVIIAIQFKVLGAKDE
ncbi:sugar ABC transporter permease [Sinomonas sp. ASV322]|uniref:carbohydrate ABC transporter permease n=1 Tax=Sinomonas sp. ASV322 TaxID=3041920 RepID=UPI0027DBE094|nr:sugar ABC transporter permease [Sinomonas sp. ASV322]MDQ4504291.1 sugar ABC transporter permease [Sinomonas sp. ASV322]